MILRALNGAPDNRPSTCGVDMPALPNVQRWLAAALTAGMFAAVLIYATLDRGPGSAPILPGAVQAGGPKSSPGDWSMFGGNATRNMVNLTSKSLPVEWETDGKNIKWVADLGSRSYG